MNQEPSTVQKKGSINKCPSCGAQLGAFVSSCSSCGHEFTDIEANRTITALASRFDEIEKEVDEKKLTGKRREQAILEKRARVIRDYPIPNSRDDLQQLLYFIQPKLVESVKPDPNIEDWRAKFTEVLNRAKNAYKDDSSALAEFARIENSLNTSLSENLTIKAKRNPLFVVLLVGIIVLGLIWFVSSQIEHSKIKECEEKYTQGSQAERDRLDKIFASADLDYKNKKYPEALAASAKLRWEYEGSCKADENQKAKALWEDKRSQMAALIQKGADADVAEKDAAANRQLAEKQAEIQKTAELARIDAEKEAAKVAEVRRRENDKKW